ncbi:NAD(P)/FAD-dependent oxidoreductase [Pseudomonas moraviensis subsp. stanleyae]|uniref:NAD(P)/FAD-dependent oxidoreductase n=1 Tax=Pseudomonas moraviensis TaxID=321662 RepID=UPI002E359FB5|nr:NAD(P)/FAD-dependent oxidoreductase [Pseudomonas moraviensis]MED7669071.1 NAD(P)/FAD-dependent oxidoreductase [Pseudomonas moraviensis subsp. stanleyae]
MKHFDVVVIGAGPAGCASAISCARHGLSVALLERQAFPRFRPGESLHPGIEPLLRRLGAADLLRAPSTLRFEGQWVHWNGLPRFNPFGADVDGPWHGFQITRAQLDGALLQQAALAGVDVHQPCRARRVLTFAQQVIGVEADAGCLYASYLIDASGATGWLGRQLHLTEQIDSPALVARYGYLQGQLEPYGSNPHLLATEDGWTWIARIGAQLIHWTHLAFEIDALKAVKPSPPMLPEDLLALPQVGPMRGAEVSWRISASVAGGGYFLVGDAASRLDPASSHGVLKALMSGMQAAQAIHDSLARPLLRTLAQAQYQQWLRCWYEHDLTQLRSFYGRHPLPPRWLGTD